ncbi:DUF3618 domain-containing protein [Streptosporangium sp. NPDC000396]|uniref:DUF3618 domain-containing protein n=1 Tax=Streptosporangium sp. NPDC000396 TaxID=3366185 RepID=UPI0036CCF08D
MTETDPGTPARPEAGTTGSRRKGVDEPITPDESGSLNIPPNAPLGASAEEAEIPASGHSGRSPMDLGGPPSGRDETSRPAEETAAGEEAAGRTAAAQSVTGETEADETEAGETSEESVRRDIENDRRELGDTVEALVHKTDVKGRVQEAAAHMGEDLRRMGVTTATGVVGRVREAPVELKDMAGRVTHEAGKRPATVIAAMTALAVVVFRVLRRDRSGGPRCGRSGILNRGRSGILGHGRHGVFGRGRSGVLGRGGLVILGRGRKKR